MNQIMPGWRFKWLNIVIDPYAWHPLFNRLITEGVPVIHIGITDHIMFSDYLTSFTVFNQDFISAISWIDIQYFNACFSLLNL
ncbi:Uncharacterised protein [Serratia marcescens]|nr:Uncharacterised protein [Serratia marcescens]